MKCRLTAWAWFSIFLEKAFVRRVKRRIPIRIVRLPRSELGSSGFLSPDHGGPISPKARQADDAAIPRNGGVHLRARSATTARPHAASHRGPAGQGPLPQGHAG